MATEEEFEQRVRDSLRKTYGNENPTQEEFDKEAKFLREADELEQVVNGTMEPTAEEQAFLNFMEAAGQAAETGEEFNKRLMAEFGQRAYLQPWEDNYPTPEEIADMAKSVRETDAAMKELADNYAAEQEAARAQRLAEQQAFDEQQGADLDELHRGAPEAEQAPAEQAPAEKPTLIQFLRSLITKDKAPETYAQGFGSEEMFNAIAGAFGIPMHGGEQQRNDIEWRIGQIEGGREFDEEAFLTPIFANDKLSGPEFEKFKEINPELYNKVQAQINQKAPERAPAPAPAPLTPEQERFAYIEDQMSAMGPDVTMTEEERAAKRAEFGKAFDDMQAEKAAGQTAAAPAPASAKEELTPEQLAAKKSVFIDRFIEKLMEDEFGRTATGEIVADEREKHEFRKKHLADAEAAWEKEQKEQAKSEPMKPLTEEQEAAVMKKADDLFMAKLNELGADAVKNLTVEQKKEMWDKFYNDEKQAAMAKGAQEAQEPNPNAQRSGVIKALHIAKRIGIGCLAKFAKTGAVVVVGGLVGAAVGKIPLVGPILTPAASGAVGFFMNFVISKQKEKQMLNKYYQECAAKGVEPNPTEIAEKRAKFKANMIKAGKLSAAMAALAGVQGALATSTTGTAVKVVKGLAAVTTGAQVLFAGMAAWGGYKEGQQIAKEEGIESRGGQRLVGAINAVASGTATFLAQMLGGALVSSIQSAIKDAQEGKDVDIDSVMKDFGNAVKTRMAEVKGMPAQAKNILNGILGKLGVETESTAETGAEAGMLDADKDNIPDQIDRDGGTGTGAANGQEAPEQSFAEKYPNQSDYLNEHGAINPELIKSGEITEGMELPNGHIVDGGDIEYALASRAEQIAMWNAAHPAPPEVAPRVEGEYLGTNAFGQPVYNYGGRNIADIDNTGSIEAWDAISTTETHAEVTEPALAPGLTKAEMDQLFGGADGVFDPKNPGDAAAYQAYYKTLAAEQTHLDELAEAPGVTFTEKALEEHIANGGDTSEIKEGDQILHEDGSVETVTHKDERGIMYTSETSHNIEGKPVTEAEYRAYQAAIDARSEALENATNEYGVKLNGELGVDSSAMNAELTAIAKQAGHEIHLVIKNDGTVDMENSVLPTDPAARARLEDFVNDAGLKGATLTANRNGGVAYHDRPIDGTTARNAQELNDEIRDEFGPKLSGREARIASARYGVKVSSGTADLDLAQKIVNNQANREPEIERS